MIQIVPQMKLILSVDPIDFRCGINSLCGICRRVLDQDPFSGYVFLFTNKRRVGIKILVYDEQGFWLCYKKLSKGRLKWWPTNTNQASITVSCHELQAILMNLNPGKLDYKFFKKVSVPSFS